jgi:hypothetical protein
MNGHSQTAPACLKSANFGGDRAGQAAAFRVSQDDDVDRTCQNLSSRRAFSVVSLAN